MERTPCTESPEASSILPGFSRKAYAKFALLQAAKAANVRRSQRLQESPVQVGRADRLHLLKFAIGPEVSSTTLVQYPPEVQRPKSRQAWCSHDSHVVLVLNRTDVDKNHAESLKARGCLRQSWRRALGNVATP